MRDEAKGVAEGYLEGITLLDTPTMFLKRIESNGVLIEASIRHFAPLHQALEAVADEGFRSTARSVGEGIACPG